MISGVALDPLGTCARSAGDRRKFDLNEAEITTVQPIVMKPFEQGTISFVEDHSQADHSGTEMMPIEIEAVLHAAMIAGACPTARAVRIDLISASQKRVFIGVRRGI
jgi:hypothetical protein